MNHIAEKPEKERKNKGRGFYHLVQYYMYYTENVGVLMCFLYSAEVPPALKKAIVRCLTCHFQVPGLALLPPITLSFWTL